ncbi:M23 family metallopeptidase [Candidatus Parcubacteria bacterium]|nr:M23 family metallopeptidase [Candidatus Parcubacteria bacterium]
MFNQRLVHVLVVVITFLLLFINLSTRTEAGGLTDLAHKTILASLINPEFSVNNIADEQLIVETFDREAIISPTQQSYLDNLGSFKAQQRVVMENHTEEEDEFLQIIKNGASIVRPEIAETKITKRDREKIITHKVQPGDSVSTIAQNYGISVSTILWENNLSAYSIIRPGDNLDILPMSGITYKIKSGDSISKVARQYNIEGEKIASVNKLENNSLKIGQKLIIPGAKKAIYSSYKPTTYTGFEAIKNIVKAPSAKPVVGNKMNWPTIGKRITQYYSWRHHGLDIANRTGTPLYAADAGTVEVAGWGTGYGNQIVINHGGGKKTRYAHCSKFYVKKGNTVTKGQTIAAMGSTGWSTGSHIHFEIIINGAKKNPLNYIR